MLKYWQTKQIEGHVWEYEKVCVKGTIYLNWRLHRWARSGNVMRKHGSWCVHYLMMVNSAQPGKGGRGGGGARSHYISIVTSQVVVYASAERADTLLLFLLYPFISSVGLVIQRQQQLELPEARSWAAPFRAVGKDHPSHSTNHDSWATLLQRSWAGRCSGSALCVQVNPYKISLVYYSRE